MEILNSMNKLELLAAEIKQNPIEASADIYHPIPFDEFKDLSISSSEKAVMHKWAKIKSITQELFGTDMNGRKVLDIGANAGFYTYNFSKLGAAVSAFEPHPRYKDLGLKIIEEKKLNIRWENDLVQVNHPYLKDKYDLTLMLSVYQWMAEGGKEIKYAESCLQKISEQSDYLIFELGFNKGKSHLKTNKLNHYRALVDMLSEKTNYQHFKLIGKTKLWRNYSRYLVLCSNNPAYSDDGLPKMMRKINL